MRTLLALVAAATFVLATGAQAQNSPPPSPSAWTVPGNDEIRRILVERIDQQHDGVGIVVGVIDAHGRRYVSYGVSDAKDPRPMDERSLFEIGSITKVFTSLLLSEMVVDHEVALSDPVAKYLPAGTKVPERGGRQITLEDLSAHRSGLPRMPGNFDPKDPTNPYADYTEERMYAFLATYQLPRDIGSLYQYSNLGGGLLGDALAHHAGVDYETLVKRRITGPLGMRDTVITLTPELRARLAKGHTATLAPTANWDLATLAPAGALRSDAVDLLTFLGAELGYVKTPLKPAMDFEHSIYHPTTSPTMRVALAWHTMEQPGRDMVIWHNGGTGGYKTFAGFDPKTGVGVVVLTNASTDRGGDDIGFHLLTGAPLAPPPKPRVEHHAIAFDPNGFDAYVGVYRFAPQAAMTITREGEHAYMQFMAQRRLEIFPETATSYFITEADVQVSFNRGADGAVASLTLHQDGHDITAPREHAP